MKKITSLLLAGLLMLSLAACGSDTTGGTNPNTGSNTGTAANSGTPNTTNTGMNTDRMGDYLNNNATNTNYRASGMGADYEPTGSAFTGKNYADSDYQHSGVTGASKITADM